MYPNTVTFFFMKKKQIYRSPTTVTMKWMPWFFFKINFTLSCRMTVPSWTSLESWKSVCAGKTSRSSRWKSLKNWFSSKFWQTSLKLKVKNFIFDYSLKLEDNLSIMKSCDFINISINTITVNLEIYNLINFCESES